MDSKTSFVSSSKQYFERCSLLQQSFIISILVSLILAPFVNTIGSFSWMLLSVSFGIIYHIVFASPEEIKEVSVEKKKDDIPEEETREQPTKRVYSMNKFLDLKEEEKNVPFYNFKVIPIHHNSRSNTPITHGSRDNSTSNYRLSARSSSPIMFYTTMEGCSNSRSLTPIVYKSLEMMENRDSTPNSNRRRSYEELMDYYHDDPSTLPKGDLPGRIQWIHQNNGRIRVTGDVLSTRDLFFHFNDVELKPGEVLKVGDRVVFVISVYKNLVCATHIRKVNQTRSKSTANVPRQ